MYGWKKCGGNGGKINKNVWLYGWDQQFFALTDLYAGYYPDEIKALKYKMETNVLKYKCGITDWIVVPSTRLGYPSGVKHKNNDFLCRDLRNSEILKGYTNHEYKDGFVPGNAYLYIKVAKISKSNTNVPVNYHSFYGTGGLYNLPESKEYHNRDLLKDLWKSPIPGYGFGGGLIYKKSNIYYAVPGSGEEDPDATIRGGAFPDGTPKNMVDYGTFIFDPLFRNMYIHTLNEPYALAESDYYDYNPTNNLLAHITLTYLLSDPYSAPTFAKGLNRYLFDFGENELKDLGDPNYYYSFYGFVILGA